MKKSLALGLVTFLAASSAFAACPVSQETSDLQSEEGFAELFTVDVKSNVENLTDSESEMIVAATDIEDAEAAVSQFIDEPYFFNAGNIEYFTLGENTFALVTYFPGDNEYGVIAQVNTSSQSKAKVRAADFTVVATVSDGGIDCLD